jgi:hypothetical protein
MRAETTGTIVRVDRGVVEVDTKRSLRSHVERIDVPVDAGADTALAHAFATSRLLRPGRTTRTRVLVETARVVYSPDARRREGRSGTATIAEDLCDGLIGAIAQRRVRGPASLELGPLSRAEAARTTFGDLSGGGVGIIADRSNAAVTVLVVGSSRIVWARSVPSDDACLAVRLLVHRAFGMLHLRERPRWWRLHDVATAADPRSVLRDASEFAAAAASELDGVPLDTQVLA